VLRLMIDPAELVIISEHTSNIASLLTLSLLAGSHDVRCSW